MMLIKPTTQLIRTLFSKHHPILARTFAIYNPPASSSPNLQPIAVRLGGPGGSAGGGQGGALGFPATYNELPLPAGDWGKFYSEQQQKYNRHLIIGLSMFCATVYTMRQVIDFNFGPPPLEEEGEEEEFCAVKVEVKKCDK